jgi:predicted DNA-binding ribbon-helix-helix protein
MMEFLTIMKEYGLSGVLAWLFWWTLRRMINSHDTTVAQLKGQLEAQCQAARTADESFARVVENHLTHTTGALERFEASLGHHADEQRRWGDRLLGTLDRIDARLRGERSAT